ncbi:MAG TPA: SCO6880 family protein [Acidimicrobiales bacterium]|nr:SCO6880 family protein [Acidimicrobiales bacterium]
MAPERDERLYRFDPADDSGIFLGLSVLQCALVGAGLFLSVTALSAGVPLVVAAVPALAGAAASFARLRGRPAWEWLGVAWAWAALCLGRHRRWVAPLALVPDDAGRPTPLPPCLAGLTIADVAWRGRRRLGAVRDTEAGTLTAALRVAGPPFVVQPRSEQERLVAGWGDVLNAFATEGGPVTHVSWSDLAAPSGLKAHRAWLASVEGGEPHPEARASYDELLAGATECATAHDVVVSITVAAARLGRRHGSEPDAALARALGSSVEALLRAADSAGLVASEPLSAAELQRVLRVRCDPAAARPAVVAGRLVERLGLVGPAEAGPMALEADWGHVRIDAAFHRCWRVAAWPRLPVTPAWLEPFLSGPGVTRTMTVVFCPVALHRSRRRIERDLVKLDSDAVTKEAKGRRVDARHRRATQALHDREDELVAGFAEMGYVGLVSVSAPSGEALAEAAEITEQAAREAGLELRCLEARQDLAWASALPFGLAPKHLLGE